MLLRRFVLLAVFVASSQVLLAQAAAPATGTVAGPTGASGPSAPPSRLHWVAENVKDVALIGSAVLTVILFIVAAVLITKRGRVMILGAVLDGMATDPAGAERLYSSVLKSDEKAAKILSAVLNGLANDPASARRLYEIVLLLERTSGEILSRVVDGIGADAARARKIYDSIISIDEDRGKIYDRVIRADEERGKITATVINRLWTDSKNKSQLLDLLVLASLDPSQIRKAAQDIRAVSGAPDAGQEEKK